MWHIETDYVSGNTNSGLTLRRTYNSNPFNWDANAVRTFGARWTQQYDVVVRQEAAELSPQSSTCWRRADTGEIICERYPMQPPGSLPIPDAVSVLRGDGKRYLFNRGSVGWATGSAWATDANTNERLSATYDSNNTAVIGWTYLSAQSGNTERFDAAGRLISITDRGGAVQRLTYSDGSTNDTSIARLPADAPVCTNTQTGEALPAGRLLCVTDSWNRQLQYEYDSKGHIVKVITPGNQAILYEYDGPSGGCLVNDANNPACNANNLTKVTFPGGKSRIYYFNEAAQINGGATCAGISQTPPGFAHSPHLWTGLVDENGDRHISWTYDCIGRATSSQLGNGAEKVSIAYPNYSTDYGATGGAVMSVSHYSGMPESPVKTTSKWEYKKVLGSAKVVWIDRPCAECGGAVTATYDANGNVAQKQEWVTNNVTRYTYDLARNLEIKRVEGSALTPRTITTEWHASLRLPVKIAEPKRITTIAYDSVGNVLTKTVQATSDESGTQGMAAVRVGLPRTSTYTYNAFGQLLSVTGPRDDVIDVTRYEYDSISGNLIKITNAAGHVTTLSNYDADGRVGTIVAPTGVKTDLTYTPRGWLKSQTISGTGGAPSLVTTYEYNGTGQMISVTQPGQSPISFGYDSAHRLTDVTDGMGNAIHYVLDIMGNRVQEQAKDANGNLARQATRIFDSMKRLMSVTGAAQ